MAQEQDRRPERDDTLAPRGVATRRILAVHAHPDDVEFQCAGTLALLAGAGHHITIVTMTAGDCGSRDLGPAEIARRRRQEAQASAEQIGAAYECLEFADLSIVVDIESKRLVTEMIRCHRPDVVLTAPPHDYMDDHEATSRLVRDACFNASCPNYATRRWDPASATERIPHLYYVDPIDGTDTWGRPVAPQFYIDITETFETKQKMLACHASQREWLRAQHGLDEYLDSQRRFAEQRGREAGVTYAEGFRQHLGHAYPADNVLAELLSGKLIERFEGE